MGVVEDVRNGDLRAKSGLMNVTGFSLDEHVLGACCDLIEEGIIVCEIAVLELGETIYLYEYALVLLAFR